jgi:transposase
VETFFGKLEGTEVIMEACGGAHHWGRVLARLGHEVRLIPAQYVRPFVRRAKNDRPTRRRSTTPHPGPACPRSRSRPPSTRPS